MQSIVRFQSVSKSFANKMVIDDFDLELPAEQCFALVGASGCGKSTVLNLINGLLIPDQGKVTVFGKPIDYNQLPKLRRKIGYAVQNVGLFPHLTVIENLSLLAKLEKWQQQEISKRADHLLSLVELPLTIKNNYPHQLSGGQQQRVGLARAMFLNPSLLLLDESFSAVDVITRHSIHKAFLNLLRIEKASVLLVTHDIREAQKLGDRIIVMEEGKISQAGNYDDLVSNPKSEFVRELIEL